MVIGRRGAAAMLPLLVVSPGLTLAQSYPTRPVRIIVPTGAGGITDLIARQVAQRLSGRLGGPVIVENRPGAGGIIGTEAAARAQPDGHTLLMVFPSHAVNPSLRAALPYDTIRDFAPITTVTTVTLVLLVPDSLPAHSLEELIALSRRQTLTFASVGAGSLGHLAGELFRSMAGIEMTHIPYRSAPDAHVALLRGDVSMFFDPPITALPHVREQRLRALAVSSLTRSPVMPDVPTVSEAGVPDYEVIGWNGILAPAGTPAPILDTLNREIRAVLNEPELQRWLIEQGAEPAPAERDAFSQRISADITKWADVIRNAGIRPE
jgi:tripartite-type tricarboxylate transporter receptor subunit TctC